MAEKLVAIMRDGQSARVAIEERDAEIRFQLFQGFGDRRLRDRKVLRRARHRTLFGNGDKILELTKREGHAALEHAEIQPDKSVNIRTFFGVLFSQMRFY